MIVDGFVKKPGKPKKVNPAENEALDETALKTKCQNKVLLLL